MFGDAYAHDFEDFPAIFKDPKFPLAKHQLDWRDEADELLSKVCDDIYGYFFTNRRHYANLLSCNAISNWKSFVHVKR